MSGNASFRPVNTTVLSVCAVEAPVVMTSAAFDERLAETYRRVGTRPGMLEKLAGVVERRWWPADVSFADAAIGTCDGLPSHVERAGGPGFAQGTYCPWAAQVLSIEPLR